MKDKLLAMITLNATSLDQLLTSKIDLRYKILVNGHLVFELWFKFIFFFDQFIAVKLLNQ